MRKLLRDQISDVLFQEVLFNQDAEARAAVNAKLEELRNLGPAANALAMQLDDAIVTYVTTMAESAFLAGADVRRFVCDPGAAA